MHYLIRGGRRRVFGIGLLHGFYTGRSQAHVEQAKLERSITMRCTDGHENVPMRNFCPKYDAGMFIVVLE